MNRSVITIDDLTNDEIDRLFNLADRYVSDLGEHPHSHRLLGKLDVAKGKIASTLFFEPSTRTKFSFEAAMFRLGGDILQTVDPRTNSSSKGESLADMVRVVQSYADLVILRHPREGAARVAAEYVDVPVINAGDGSHEHPTQTLCDLYTLRRERKSLTGLNVLLCGDLKNGRTVHSLVYALARFGARIVTAPAKGLELPPHVSDRLQSEYHCVALTSKDIALPDDVDMVFVPLRDEKIRGLPDNVDVLYVTPNQPHKLALIPDFNLSVHFDTVTTAVKEIDVIYGTRLQTERLAGNSGTGDYPVIDKAFLDKRGYTNAQVLHPLPRVKELGYDLDKDPRGAYFKQTAYGVPVRMALLAALLQIEPVLETRGSETHYFRNYSCDDGLMCSNERCISRDENEGKHLKPKFWIVNPAQQSFLPEMPLTVRCMYCEYDYKPSAIGRKSSRQYNVETSLWDQIESEDLVVFCDFAQAQHQGYNLVDPSVLTSARG
jgi:aspartate carbamoyltransferase catalytic subunit